MSLRADDSPGIRMYYEGDLMNVVDGFILFGLVAAVITLYKLLSHRTTQREKYMLLVGWAIIPPLWFVIEYYFVFLPHGVENSFKYFDYGQSVASKLWGAVSALTAMVLYKDNETEKKEKLEEKAKEEQQDVAECKATQDQPE